MTRGPGLPAAARGVLFDLDGTLVDTVPDLAAAANAALAAAGREVVAEADVRNWVGNGARVLLARCLSGRMETPAEPDPALDQVLEGFLEAYARGVCAASRPYPGVPAVLDTLRAHGKRLACVTNKPGGHARALLEALDLARTFDVIVGGDAVARSKPDAEPVRAALGALVLEPGEAVFVGDSRNDVLAARAAGVAIVCVSYGYNHGRNIREARPDAVVDAFDELPALLSARPGDGRPAAP